MKRTGKLLSLALTGALALSLTACGPTTADTQSPAPTPAPTEAVATPVPSQSAGGAFTPGTYEGEAQGMESVIKVAVTLTADKIETVEVLESAETATIGEVALETLPDSVVTAQSTQLDAVSGATVTCDAFFAAVDAALTAAGVDPASLVPISDGKGAQSGEHEALSCDLVIVGAGGAGMTAALRAKAQGLDVLLLEKQAFVGGATAMSSSSALCQGTRVQAEQGVEDSPELCMADLLRVGDYQNDGTPAWLLSKYSGEAVDWLNDDMGVLFEEDVGGPSAEYSAGRARMSVTYSGAGLCQDLQNTVDGSGVPLMLNTRAYELTDTDGVVDGVLARDVNTGKEYTVSAKAVLLATGGYCFDDDYIGAEFEGLPCSGSKANTGDGIDMALPMGAVLQSMDLVAVAGHGIRKGDSAQHTKPGCLTAYGTTGTILVNMDGERFISETGTDASIVDKMYTEGRVFMLMDEAAFKPYAENCTTFRYFSQEELDQWLTENGTGTTVFAHGDTLADVAARVGMDADGLAATVERYNGYVAAGEDTEFGRDLSIAVGDGPYYLVEQCLRYSTTLGGLTINDQLQLVDGTNAPIPGLYAAGEMIGGVFGAHFPPSSGVGWALTSGYLAGGEIAVALGK